MDSEIFEIKDPSKFRTHPISLSMDTSGGYSIRTQSENLAFPQMANLRKKGFSGALPAQLANAGLSVALSVDIGNDTYAINVHQLRKDRTGEEHGIVKLISGYMENDDTPLEAVCKELGEEVLPCDGDSYSPIRIFTYGMLQSGTQYPQAKYNGTPAIVRLVPEAASWLPQPQRRVTLDGVVQPFTQAYIDGDSNSVQYVLTGKLLLPRGIQSLEHIEDVLIDQGANKILAAKKAHPLLLAKLDEGKMTGEFYRMHNGVLVPQRMSNPKFSEAYCKPDSQGVVRGSNINMDKCLLQQESFFLSHPYRGMYSVYDSIDGE